MPSDESLFTAKLEDLYKNNPAKLLALMAFVAGRACVKANAGKLDVKTEAVIDSVRYEILVNVKIKKV